MGQFLRIKFNTIIEFEFYFEIWIKIFDLNWILNTDSGDTEPTLSWIRSPRRHAQPENMIYCYAFSQSKSYKKASEQNKIGCGRRHKQCSVLQMATGIGKAGKVSLLVISCGPGEKSFPESRFKLLQFPIMIFFATTTNKARWQFLKKSSECTLWRLPSHGKLYVTPPLASHLSNISVHSEGKTQKPRT